ncbi:MAG TPA: ATP-dependent Clp protease adapter ClpS [Thermodesulfovibrionales bacterium]|nr:ATP-dependent Clp protease adapter ClpS [Thermodesulfovibrionales bacterium]
MGDNELKIAGDRETKTEEEVKSPSLYKVFLLNDDYTTMDFVILILEEVFHKPSAEAAQIMLHVHKKGIGLCGVYTRDIAETRVTRVHELARQRGFPLMCTMEKE